MGADRAKEESSPGGRGLPERGSSRNPSLTAGVEWGAVFAGAPVSEVPKTECLQRQNILSHCSEAWKSETEMPPGSLSGLGGRLVQASPLPSGGCRQSSAFPGLKRHHLKLGLHLRLSCVCVRTHARMHTCVSQFLLFIKTLAILDHYTGLGVHPTPLRSH